MIAITGVSGYIGIHLAKLLQDKDEKLIGIIKKDTAKEDLDVLERYSIPYKKVDFFDPNAMDNALVGVTKVVHLVGSIYRPKKISMEELHKNITSILVASAKKNNIKKLIYVSALGSEITAASDYHKTKSFAEQEIKNSGIPYVILQPSLIFGKLHGIRNSKIVARLSQSITKLPFIPIIGNGKNKLQPLFITDLCRCIYESMREEINNVTIQLGGPQALEFEEIAKTIAKSVNMDKKRPFHIKKGAARILASIMETLSAQPKITRDQVKMIGKDNVVTSDLMDKYFKFEKSSLTKELNHLI